MTVETTASNLQYEDAVVGDGAQATASQYVTVHYTSWLYEDGQTGRKSNPSRDHNDPFVFHLGGGMVIKDWGEGV